MCRRRTPVYKLGWQEQRQASMDYGVRQKGRPTLPNREVFPLAIGPTKSTFEVPLIFLAATACFDGRLMARNTTSKSRSSMTAKP